MLKSVIRSAWESYWLPLMAAIGVILVIAAFMGDKQADATPWPEVQENLKFND